MKPKSRGIPPPARTSERRRQISNGTADIPPSKAQQLVWLHEIDPHLGVLVRAALHRRGWSVPAFVVDEIIQDVRVSLWQSDLERYRPHLGALRSFVSRRVLWTVAGRLRTRYKEGVKPIVDVTDDRQAPSPEDIWCDHERHLQRTRLFPWIERRLSCPVERAAVLASLDGETLADVAVRLDVPPWRVKEARQRGQARLRLLVPDFVDAAGALRGRRNVGRQNDR